MRKVSAVALAVLLGAAIILLWVPAYWPVAILQTGILTLGIAWAVRMVFHPYRLETSLILLPFCGTVLWGLVQLASGQTVYRFVTWTAVLTWTTNVVACILAMQIAGDVKLCERLLRAMLIFGCGLAALATLQLYTAEGKVFWLFDSGYRDLVMGPFVYHNQYAAWMELLLPLALFAALTERRHRIVYAVMAAIMYASVIASASRAGFVLASAELIVVPGLVFRRSRRAREGIAMTMAVMLGLAGIFTFAVGWDVLWQRLQHADPFTVRREFLQSSLAMWRTRPYLGFGLGTWSTAYPAYASFDDGRFANQAHNDWVQWACEGGLPFLAVMGWLAFGSVRAAFRSIWGIGIASVFLHCLIDYPIERPGLAAMFFFFLGLVIKLPDR